MYFFISQQTLHKLTDAIKKNNLEVSGLQQSELYLYEALLLEESGNYERAIKTLRVN